MVRKFCLVGVVPDQFLPRLPPWGESSYQKFGE